MVGEAGKLNFVHAGLDGIDHDKSGRTLLTQDALELAVVDCAEELAAAAEVLAFQRTGNLLVDPLEHDSCFTAPVQSKLQTVGRDLAPRQIGGGSFSLKLGGVTGAQRTSKQIKNE